MAPAGPKREENEMQSDQLSTLDLRHLLQIEELRPGSVDWSRARQLLAPEIRASEWMTAAEIARLRFVAWRHAAEIARRREGR